MEIVDEDTENDVDDELCNVPMTVLLQQALAPDDLMDAIEALGLRVWVNCISVQCENCGNPLCPDLLKDESVPDLFVLIFHDGCGFKFAIKNEQLPSIGCGYQAGRDTLAAILSRSLKDLIGKTQVIH